MKNIILNLLSARFMFMLVLLAESVWAVPE